jgi:hypothetical protein
MMISNCCQAGVTVQTCENGAYYECETCGRAAETSFILTAAMNDATEGETDASV